MKFNWGHGIFLFFLMFATFILFMVVKMSHEKYDLVSDDYYNKEIAYQSTIDEAHNSIVYNERANITVNTSGDILADIITGTKEPVKAVLSFYKPDNKEADFVVATMLTADPLIVPMQGKPKGRWHVNIIWENKGHKAASAFDIER